MDAYVFRLLALELKKFMHGGRVEKINSPLSGLFNMTVYNHGLKLNLLLRHSRFVNPGTGQIQSIKNGVTGERRSPAMYLSAQKLPNPEKPSTIVMTLRKYLIGHRLGAASVDWLNRRVLVPLPQRSTMPKMPSPLWLCLDLINGPSLLSEPPVIPAAQWPDAMRPEAAPDTEGIAAWGNALRGVLADLDVWRQFPALTPALRKTLSTLLEQDAWDAASLLTDLQYDLERESGCLCLYQFAGEPRLLSAWPLPEAAGLDLRETVTHAGNTESDSEQRFPALEAARLVYEPQVAAGLGASVYKEEARAAAAEEKRLVRILLKLEQEAERLRRLSALRDDAVRLQAVLWRYGQDEKNPSVSFTEGESPGGQPRQLTLDPMLTVRENMARLFRQSDRGRRGLEFVQKRHAELQAELEKVKSGLSFQIQRKKNERANRNETSRTNTPKKHCAKADPARLIQRFLSSDGFTILRGRSALGNQALLRLAQPHDLWLHVEGGPSAHVVIRRERFDQEIPQRTMREAGILSAVKSWRKTDSKAEIIAALVKDVRPLKGGAPGTVLVDKRQAGFMVAVDHTLADRLAGDAQSTWF